MGNQKGIYSNNRAIFKEIAILFKVGNTDFKAKYVETLYFETFENWLIAVMASYLA